MTKKLPQNFVVLPPSSGVDNNWHVTDVDDTMVAHCYGFNHDLESGEPIARRIAAALNYCSGMSTKDIEANKDRIPDPLPKLNGALKRIEQSSITQSLKLTKLHPSMSQYWKSHAEGVASAIRAVERMQKRILEG